MTNADGMVEEFAINPNPLVIAIDDHEALCQRLGLGYVPTIPGRGGIGRVPEGLSDAERCQRLGLGVVPDSDSDAALSALEYYPEWRGRQLKAWRKFMPTRYLESAWYRYKYDTVPLRALKAIEAAKSLDVFRHLEIWTPENRRLRRTPATWLLEEVDPVCVGVADYYPDVGVAEYYPERVFPIVRWGNEELVSERAVRFYALFLRTPSFGNFG